MEKGDFIKIDYVGKLESGEIFDLTNEELAKKENIYNPKIKYRPIPIIVGAGFVIPGLDKALSEMKIGEKKSINIRPEDGFGQRNPSLIKVVPRNAFKDVEPRQGMIVDFSGIKGRIQSVSAGRIMVDFNNPLAGKVLIYDLEVKEKIENTNEKIISVFDFFGIENVENKMNNGILDIEAKVPPELKEKISSLMIEYVRPENKKIEKVRFIESYGKK